MEGYAGLFIGMEHYTDAVYLPRVSFAENDATEVRDAFLNLGCIDDRLELLTSEQATCSAIRAKIKRLSSMGSPSDTLIFYYAGHGIFHGARNVITCRDTMKGSEGDTTIPINEILAEFQRSACKRVIMFLDCCHSSLVFSGDMFERSGTTTFSSDELLMNAKDAEHLVLFSAAKDDEKSISLLELKHGVWSYFLIQALKGNAPPAIYEDRILMHDKLQSYLASETSLKVSLNTNPKKRQTPFFNGKHIHRFIVADLRALFDRKAAQTEFGQVPIKQTVLVRWDEAPIKKLPDFNPFKHSIPMRYDVKSIKWIRQLAGDVVHDELVKVREMLRTKMKIKRKEISDMISVFEGSGTITTPYFDYTVAIEHSRERLENYVITHSIGNFRDLSVINNPMFNDLFDRILEMRVDTGTTTDLVAIIDHIEDLNVDTVSILKVDDDSNPGRVEIAIKGIDDTIVLTPTTFSVLAYMRKTPTELIESFIKGRQLLQSNNALPLLGN